MLSATTKKSKVNQPMAYDNESVKTRERLLLIKEKVSAMKSTHSTFVRPNQANSNNSTDAVQTKEMLDQIDLGVYFKVFLENKMIGDALFDLTERDLDYMSIRVLAHRKSILQATRELRQSQSIFMKEHQKQCTDELADARYVQSKGQGTSHSSSNLSTSRKVTALRQDVEGSREADARRRPNTSDMISNACDFEDQEHQEFVLAVQSWRAETPQTSSRSASACTTSNKSLIVLTTQDVVERLTRDLAAEEATVLKRLEDEKRALLTAMAASTRKHQAEDLQSELATMKYESELKEFEDKCMRSFYSEKFDWIQDVNSPTAIRTDPWDFSPASARCIASASLDALPDVETMYYIQE